MTPSQQLLRVTARSAVNLRDRLLRSDRLVQAGQTPYQLIHEQDIVRLRYYPPLDASHVELLGERVPVRAQPHRVPLVLVAPLAVNMLIYDLFPQRSLVRYLRARGFEVYLVDWGRPDARHDHWRLKSYIAEQLPALLERVRAHSGQRQLSLHGWSFGGLFSLCHAALSADPDIVNLALIGAPCDYHANGQLGRQYQRLSRQLRTLQRLTRFRVHRTPQRLWRSPGWANSLAFKLTNPVGSLRGYGELFKNLHDRRYVSDHATNGAFLHDMVAYPGGVMQDIIQCLWVDNLVAQGRLPIHGCAATLRQVTANLLVVAGHHDVIVTADCTRPILGLVSSPDQTYLEILGGHMGILGGSQAAKHLWPQLADWLAARSE